MTTNVGGTVTLRLNAEESYSSSDNLNNAYAEGRPYEPGTYLDFILRHNPSVPLSAGEGIVVWQGRFVTPENGTEPFAGAIVASYKKDGRYYDLDGNLASMPPTVDLGWYSISNPLQPK